MTSRTITKMEEEPKESINSNTNSLLKDEIGNKTNQRLFEMSPYYDETLSKNDPKFLAGVRRWEKNIGFVTTIRWVNVWAIFLVHILASMLLVYTLCFTTLLWKTLFFEFVWGQIGGFGVTAGVHRYWTHRSYKAKLPLQMVLALSYSVAGQNSIYDWVRDHRLHHKMSETSADPHDANRGFFFSHVGWLMMKKHPHVIQEGRKIDMSDIVNDPLVQFHTRFFTFFKVAFCFVLPIMLPVYCWGEIWSISISATIVRYVIGLNFTWSVNSFAHLWGNKPYDPRIMPVENWSVSFVTLGEGWHNYHHTFPWDYKAAELSYFLNSTTFILDLFAIIGWAYDMKKASPSFIKSVIDNRNSGKLKKSTYQQEERNSVLYSNKVK